MQAHVSGQPAWPAVLRGGQPLTLLAVSCSTAEVAMARYASNTGPTHAKGPAWIQAIMLGNAICYVQVNMWHTGSGGVSAGGAVSLSPQGDGGGNACHPPSKSCPHLPLCLISGSRPQRVPRPLPSGPRVQRPTSVAESPASDLSLASVGHPPPRGCPQTAPFCLISRSRLGRP